MVWDVLDKVSNAHLIKEISEGSKGQANHVETAAHHEVGQRAFIFGSNAKCLVQNEVVPIMDSPKCAKK